MQSAVLARGILSVCPSRSGMRGQAATPWTELARLFSGVTRVGVTRGGNWRVLPYDDLF